MKDDKSLHKGCLIVFILILTVTCTAPSQVYADGELKVIRTYYKDTTGDSKKETINVLADVENKGYYLEISHETGEKYFPKPDERFGQMGLAPYTPFWDLNLIIGDINGDSTPEIFTWGDGTHEVPIHIFRWNGAEYQRIYSGFYEGFSFRDITGDGVLEFIIQNRLYGTGYEYLYYQWQNDHYQKILYEIDANRGFDVLEGLIYTLPIENQYIYSEQVLESQFTKDWLEKMDNIKALKKFKKDLFSIQLLKQLNTGLEFEEGLPAHEGWKFKVRTFRLKDGKMLVEDMIMTAGLRFIDNPNFDGWDKWRIDELRFESVK